MPVLSASDPKLTASVAAAAKAMVQLAQTAAGVSHQLTAGQARAAGLGPTTLSSLLTTGVPHTTSQQPLVHAYAVDKRTGDVAYTVNYDLTP